MPAALVPLGRAAAASTAVAMLAAVSMKRTYESGSRNAGGPVQLGDRGVGVVPSLRLLVSLLITGRAIQTILRSPCPPGGTCTVAEQNAAWPAVPPPCDALPFPP